MRGPLSYVGGKNRLAHLIIDKIPQHTTYVEPFAGGAQVFFQKPPSKVEVLNDLDGELVNFYRVCQHHYTVLLEYLRFVLRSREVYDRLQKTPPDTLTDILRAARYFYLQKTSFGGRVTRQSMARHVSKPPGFTSANIPQMIEDTHERLTRVQIENLPYEKVIEKYDTPETFFYIDPPYFNIQCYRYNLGEEDFRRMADLLGTIKGKFILSLNDVPEVRTIFSRFRVEAVELSYSIQKHAGRRYAELLISNF